MGKIILFVWIIFIMFCGQNFVQKILFSSNSAGQQTAMSDFVMYPNGLRRLSSKILEHFDFCTLVSNESEICLDGFCLFIFWNL